MSEFVSKIVDIALADSSAASLRDEGNHLVHGANRVYGLRFVAQESARGRNEQGGFDVKQSNPLTMELSNQIELVATQSTGCDGQLNVNISNCSHIIGERLSRG